MVDSTIIRAHHCAVGIKNGLQIKERSAVRAGRGKTPERDMEPLRCELNC